MKEGGARILSLRKQKTLVVSKVVSRDTGEPGAASEPAAFSDPVPPVLWEPASLCALMRWWRGGENGGRRGGRGRGSGQRGTPDPQNRGGA